MRTRSSIAIAIAIGPVLGLTGCGNSRTPVPSLDRPAPPGALRQISFPAAGVSLEVPRSWTVAAAPAPLLTTISSGAATVAIWSHPRPGPGPAGALAVKRAERRLLRAARRLDPTLRLIRASVTRLAGRQAVELDAFEHVGGQLRRVRSVHVFTAGEEVVLDAYAPPEAFHAVDHAVFSPLKRTLQLTRPGR